LFGKVADALLANKQIKNDYDQLMQKVIYREKKIERIAAQN
jgi:hypothetical protein